MTKRGYFRFDGKRARLLVAYGPVGFTFNSAASVWDLYETGR